MTLTDSPADSLDWNRALSALGLQPFQEVFGFGESWTVRSEQNADAGGAASASVVPKYLATASRAAGVMPPATDAIAPISSARRIAVAGILRRASRCGILGSYCS